MPAKPNRHRASTAAQAAPPWHLTLAVPLLAALALLLAGCSADPAGNYLGGFGDNVRGAALYAPQTLGDTSQYQGRPAEAALAAAQLEFLTSEVQDNPRIAPSVNPSLLSKLVVAQAEMRQALAIAPQADATLVLTQLRRAAAALQAGSQAGAEAALSGPAFPAGPLVTLARLGNLPRLPRVSEAAGAAAQDFISAPDGGRPRRR
jgi:hypothetical protein